MTGTPSVPYASSDQRRTVWAPHEGLCAITDVGLGRANNEDSFLVLSDDRVFAVADGVGGAAAGEVAGRLAVGMAVEAFTRAPAAAGMTHRLECAIRASNEGLLEVAASRRDWHGMKTALLLACVAERRIHTAHVGDVRCYRCTGTRLIALTRDHSPVGDLLAAGLLNEEEARRSPHRHLIGRALGEPDALPDIGDHALDHGDRVIICTDGVWGAMRHDELAAIAGWPGNMRHVASQLVDHAMAVGGGDNLTVVAYAHGRC